MKTSTCHGSLPEKGGIPPPVHSKGGSAEELEHSREIISLAWEHLGVLL